MGNRILAKSGKMELSEIGRTNRNKRATVRPCLEKPVVCFGVQSLIPGFVPRSTGEIGHEGRSHLSASAKCVAWSGDQGKIGQKLWTVHWSKETETGSAFTTGFGLLG